MAKMHAPDLTSGAFVLFYDVNFAFLNRIHNK